MCRRICGRKPNETQREAIANVVGDSEKALAVYEEVLIQFMEEGRPPQRVDWTLEQFIKAFRAMTNVAPISELSSPPPAPFITAEEYARLGITNGADE